MKPKQLAVVGAAALALYLPTLRYGFVQDDRAIIASNPAVHSLAAAIGAFDDPYWPRESGAGLYRPLTTLTYAVDWAISGGSPAWFHFMNALWHALATVLFALVLVRWLPPLGAGAAALVFAWHPVHVEAVANLVGRAELLAACGIFGSVLAARRGKWGLAVLCAALAMLSKEHGVIAGVVILFDRWLSPAEVKAPPVFWVAFAVVTAGYLVGFAAFGSAGFDAAAGVFLERGTSGRLAIALPAVLRAAWLLVWPVSLSSDYSPQVIPAYTGLSLAAVAGLVIAVGVPVLVFMTRRRAPALSFTAAVAGLSFLPASNLLFAGGTVLAERNLYLAVALPAALVGTAIAKFVQPRTTHPSLRSGQADARRTTTLAVGATLVVACAVLSFLRLPAWRDNRSQLLTLLAEHPESYIGHASAAAVLAGRGDTAGARRHYRIADSLYAHDPYVDAAHAIFLLELGDTSAARPLIARIRARSATAATRAGLRARFLFDWRRRDRAAALAVADSARQRFPADTAWYRYYLQ